MIYVEKTAGPAANFDICGYSRYPMFQISIFTCMLIFVIATNVVDLLIYVNVCPRDQMLSIYL